MIVLGIETSSGFISAALSINGVIHSNCLEEKNRQSEKLSDLVSSLLQRSNINLDEIDCFACTTGPGSFTGIRSGLSFIQGVSYAKGKKLIGINSLEIMLCLSDTGYVALNAGKGRYYVQEFISSKPTGDVSIASSEEFTLLKESQKIINLSTNGTLIIPDAEILCKYINEFDIDTENKVKPLYAKRPQAEIELEMKS